MSSRPKPPEQDPTRPEFWDRRFQAATIPWDAGRVPGALRAFARDWRGGRRVLIPGCGTGWEARHLAEQGWDVTAIDFSHEAVAAARTTLGPFADCVAQADFFVFDPGEPFDVVYERTFLCAMPRRTWPRYAVRMARLLAPGGALAGFFFYSAEPKGPPFGTSDAELTALLASWFDRQHDEPVSDSIPLFRDRERWQVWSRRG